MVQGYRVNSNWFANGMTIGVNMVVAVELAMVINLMASKKHGHSSSLVYNCSIKQLTLVLYRGYHYLFKLIKQQMVLRVKFSSGDPLGDILNDY